MNIESLKNARHIAGYTTVSKLTEMDWTELREISKELIDEAIARQSETEMVTCPNCGGSGVYQEYDEYDRYEVYVCGKCDGSGEVDKQQESED